MKLLYECAHVKNTMYKIAKTLSHQPTSLLSPQQIVSFVLLVAVPDGLLRNLREPALQR